MLVEVKMIIPSFGDYGLGKDVVATVKFDTQTRPIEEVRQDLINAVLEKLVRFEIEVK